MKSMKLSKKEAKEMSSEVFAKPDAPEYPYGLHINLDKESIEKLEIGALPKVGGKVKINAIAIVERVEESSTIYGKNKQLSLQITDMEVSDSEEK